MIKIAPSTEKTEKEIERNLECKLTVGEIAAFSRQLAESILKKEELELSLQSFKTNIKEKIGSVDMGISILATKVQTGQEIRLVPCVLQFDYANGSKSLIRKDTGEVVFTDPITNEERQLHLA